MKTNRTTGAILAAVSLVLAYPAASWLIGVRIETAIERNYELLGDNPSLKIVGRDYRRGVFGASETLTLELLPFLTQAAREQRQQIIAMQPGATVPPVQPMLVVVHSEIRHGPFPDGRSFAAAVVDSELQVGAAFGARLEAILGDKGVLAARTVYRFDGGGTSRLSSPDFTAYWPAAQGVGQNTLAWGGLTMDVDFAPGMHRYSLLAEAPRLEFRASRGGQASFLGMRLEAKQQRIFEDDPWLYGGTQSLSLARAIVGGEEGGEPIELRRVRYESEMPLKGDFIDLVGRLGSESLRIAGKDYGPAQYDISLRHLHARTTAKLQRALMQVSAEAPLQAEGVSAALFAPLAEPAAELLRHDPEIGIDRLSFRSPHGDASLSARFRLKGAVTEDLSSPLALVGKLDAAAEISLPEALVEELASVAAPVASLGGCVAPPCMQAATVAEGGAPAPEMAERRRIDVLVGQGLLVREGGMLRTRLALRDGRATVNGRVFDPLATGD